MGAPGRFPSRFPCCSLHPGLQKLDHAYYCTQHAANTPNLLSITSAPPLLSLLGQLAHREALTLGGWQGYIAAR